MSETLFEFTQVGRIMRVTAIDASTGAEAMILGPANASRHELQSVAAKKLRYVMGKSNDPMFNNRIT